MTPLRQRMIDDMRLAGFAERTRDVYIQAVRRIAAHYMRSPDVLSEEEVRAYLLHLRDERGVARGTFKTITAESASFIRGRSIAIGHCSPKKTRSRAEETAAADCALSRRGPRHLGCGA